VRRLLVGVLVLALLGVSLAEAGRGRLGRGAHSNPNFIISNPDPPPVSYIEITTLQTLATDGYVSGGISIPNAGPAAGGDKSFVCYMDNTASTHNIKCLSYSYETGTWTSATTLDSINPACCDGHETPSAFINPDSKVEVYYGGITAGAGSGSGARADGPYYRVGSSANSVAAFDARTTVDVLGGFTEPVGGFDTDDELHLFGQQQWDASPQGGWGSIWLTYARRSSGGTWSAVALVKDGAGTPNGLAEGFQGDPGCRPHAHVQGTTIHLLWTRSENGCAGAYRDIFYIKSTDGGVNWTNAAGSGSFAATTGLTGTFDSGDNLYDYPSTYRVYEGSVSTGWAVAQLADGTPIVALKTSSALLFRRWNGSSWTAVTIDATAGDGNGLAMAVTSADKILVWTTDGDVGDFKEWSSTDDGDSWSETTLRVNGAEARNRWPGARCYTSLGGKERCLVQWVHTFTGVSSLIYMDRPQ
jgi:hypothetical protein